MYNNSTGIYTISNKKNKYKIFKKICKDPPMSQKTMIIFPWIRSKKVFSMKYFNEKHTGERLTKEDLMYVFDQLKTLKTYKIRNFRYVCYQILTVLIFLLIILGLIAVIAVVGTYIIGVLVIGICFVLTCLPSTFVAITQAQNNFMEKRENDFKRKIKEINNLLFDNPDFNFRVGSLAAYLILDLNYKKDDRLYQELKSMIDQYNF